MTRQTDQDPPDTRKPSEELREWQRRMIYYQRTRTGLDNERKYLGWLRVSLGMVTLGFVIERLDLFLMRISDSAPTTIPSVLRWTPLVVYSAGALVIAVATWEFFADRRRIEAESGRKSWLLMMLILMMLLSVVVVAVLLLLPGGQ